MYIVFIFVCLFAWYGYRVMKQAYDDNPTGEPLKPLKRYKK